METKKTLIINCSGCGDRLTEPGGLLFGPPDICGYTEKMHACGDCWREILRHFPMCPECGERGVMDEVPKGGCAVCGNLPSDVDVGV